MTDKQNDEGIEFILQHWDLVSEQKKKILELLGITPNKPNHATGYATNNDGCKIRHPRDYLT